MIRRLLVTRDSFSPMARGRDSFQIREGSRKIYLNRKIPQDSAQIRVYCLFSTKKRCKYTRKRTSDPVIVDATERINKLINYLIVILYPLNLLFCCSIISYLAVIYLSFFMFSLYGGCTTPFSVMIAVMYLPGVTSKEGFLTQTPSGAILIPLI